MDLWDLSEDKPEPRPSFVTAPARRQEPAPPVLPEPVDVPEPVRSLEELAPEMPPSAPAPASMPEEPEPAVFAPEVSDAIPEPAVLAPVVSDAIPEPAGVVELKAETPVRSIETSRYALAADTLVTGTQRKDAVEQYRKLAATLHHVQANRGVRIVLCTSAVMSEGKTVTAANLALTLSQSFQRRVLLIDADLRRPRQHSLFDVPNTSGLYEALGAEVDRKVHVVELSPRLSLLTAGRPGPDPVHVLTSERLTRVFEDAGTSFDWVIIDTPPVLVLPDAGLLMGLVDGAVFVVGAGMTTHRMAKRATDALGRDRIIGVVMNRADDSIIQDAYGGYGSYGYASQASAAE